MGGDISKAATLFYLSNNSSVGITAFGGLVNVCNSNSSRKLPRSSEKLTCYSKAFACRRETTG